MVHEQVKIISDFLAFITTKMAQCEVWRGVSDVEFDNAKEGMEKLVMNRLYSQTFSPAISPPAMTSRSRSRNRRKEMDRFEAPGRRGQHQEDVERDEILAQKVRIYSWIREEHLDIPPLNLAQQGKLESKICSVMEVSDPVDRTVKDKRISCSPRQDHLCLELLQGHIWYANSVNVESRFLLTREN